MYNNIHTLIKDKIKKLEAAKVDLPKILANTGQTFFQLNFDKQEWDGKFWAQRKAGNWYTNKMAGHAILVGRTGDLRRAMQKTIKSFDWNKIVWGVYNVPYANFINEGTPNMPKRQFIGNNKKLMERFKQEINKQAKKILE